MQRRLLAAGMRPISAVVDVTNYVMHELGQPMHAYDADAIPGRARSSCAARARRDAGDDRPRASASSTSGCWSSPIASGRSAWPGSWAAPRTEVGAGTTRVILESAIFHGPTIRNTARRLGLRSEASMRHEKGIGHDLPRYAVDRAARLIAEITGARVARGIVDNDPRAAAAAAWWTVEVPRVRAAAGHGARRRARSASCSRRSGSASTGDGRRWR